MTDEAQRLLRSYRDGLVPPAGAKSAAWARLATTTATAGAAGGALPALKLLSAVVLGIAIGGGAIGLWLGDRPAPSSPAPGLVASVPITPPELPPAAEVAAAEPPVAVVPDVPAETELRARTTRPSSDPAPASEGPEIAGAEAPVEEPEAPFPSSTLGEETRLLAAAEAALSSADAAGALAILDDHAARFPSGVLARDRDVRRVGALCRLGRRTEALDLSAELERRHPSLHVRLERACPVE